MASNITLNKRIYKIFLTFALIGFIDNVIIPIMFKNSGHDIGDSGIIPILFYYVGGVYLSAIGLLFTTLWFFWGLIAIIARWRVKSIEKNKPPTTETTSQKVDDKEKKSSHRLFS